MLKVGSDCIRTTKATYSSNNSINIKKHKLQKALDCLKVRFECIRMLKVGSDCIRITKHPTRPKASLPSHPRRSRTLILFMGRRYAPANRQKVSSRA